MLSEALKKILEVCLCQALDAANISTKKHTADIRRFPPDQVENQASVENAQGVTDVLEMEGLEGTQSTINDTLKTVDIH